MSLSFGSNSFTVYKYEPFSYTWSYPAASSFRKTISPGIPVSTVTDISSGVQFSSATGLTVAASSGESIVLEALDASSVVLATSSNSIAIALGRFVTDLSASLEGQTFPFYRNEPVTPTVFSAPFTLNSAPTATPTLPAGLSFVSNAPSQYRLQGTPLLQTPQSNYLIIGSNVGATKFVTTRVNISVAAERMALDLSGTSILGLMEVGTAITPQVLTARCPPYPLAGSNVRYTWTPLPIGLTFTDSNGVVKSSPYVATDASSTLVLRGTPTAAGAKEFVSLGLSQASTLVTATRVSFPNISNSQAFSFSFAETVLFDDFSPPTFYVNSPLDPSAIYVRAQTYFGTTDASITTIFSPDLQDLSLNFVASQGRAYLTGTPSNVGTNTYTFRASNTNGRSRDLLQPLTVTTDSVTLSGPVDVCYNFIVSRNSSNAKDGYYPSPIAWTATVASGQTPTFTASNLNGSGLSLTTSGNTATLTGTPTTVTSLRNLRVTATAAATGASAYRDISFAVLADQFTFSNDSSGTPILVQNKAMRPVRVTATTTSGLTVRSYSSSNMPLGISITNFGVVQGTPQVDGSGSLTVVASTGFASGSNSYPYTILTDSILFFASPTVSTYAPTGSVAVQLSALSYANTTVTNYTTDLSTAFGLTMDASTGLLSGTLDPGIPIGVNPFTVFAYTGLHQDSVGATLVKSSSNVLLAFITLPAGGPVVTAPTQLVRTLYQYVTVEPIQIVATGTGTIRYYLRTSDLPAGMYFDALTGTLTGKSVDRGVRSFTVYAQDDIGVTPIVFTFTTIFPVIVRDGVTTAASYTSLLRQYTVVNAARNAENNVVYPSESRTIGEFTRPYPPDETTQTVDPNCYGACP
jgi:hypothetical protein